MSTGSKGDDPSIAWARRRLAERRDGLLSRLSGEARDLVAAELVALDEDLAQGGTAAGAVLLVDDLPDATFVLVDGRIVYANRAACEGLGDPERVRTVGTRGLDVVEPEDHEVVQERMRAVAGGEPVHARDIRLRAFDGTTRLYELVSLRVTYGGAPAILSVGRAVGEIREAQARRARAERTEALSTLVAGVAHEINNPLTYVVTNLGFALRELRASPTPAAHADVIEALMEAREGAERVRLLVKDMRMFARSDGGTREPMDVARVVRSSAGLAAAEIRARARFEVDVAPVPVLRGSESRLGQVVLNLLVNAAQAVDGRSPEQDEVRVDCRADGGRVLIRVYDTGPGIPPEIIDRIWDPFFTTKGRGGGTGLGLSVCERIVAELGGTIRVESQVGQGTVFTVSLPIERHARLGENQE